MTIVLPEPPVLRRLPELRLFPVPSAERIEVDDLTVDLEARRVEVRGRRVSLAPKEYELLVTLAAAPNRVFRKAELLRDVWGYHALARTRTLDTHACRLRRKLAGDEPPRYIINQWGYGYRLLD
jgi:DNA-binding response OmpR family regulator